MNDPRLQSERAKLPVQRQAHPVARRHWTACAAIVLVLFMGRFSQAQEIDILLPEKESQVKYALLYSFGLLTTWPADVFDPPETGPFVIGVLGTKPFPEYLARIAATKKIQGRPIAIKHFKGLDEVKHCHILYVTNEISIDVERAISTRLAKQPVLLVCERPLERGGGTGIIEFVIEAGAVKFYLNAEAAKTRQLQIDPRLLKLAKRYPTATQQVITQP